MHKAIMIIFCIKKRGKNMGKTRLNNLNTLKMGNLSLFLEK